MCETKRKRSVGRTIGLVILGVIGAAAFALAFGAIAMVLWNWLMPMIFGLMTINFWQAFGIVLLAKLLFGFGGGCGGHDNDDKCRSPREEIREEIRRGWRKEWDKEKAKEWHKKMKKRFGTGEFDEAYENWWENEGSKSFDDYMKKHEQSDASDDEV